MLLILPLKSTQLIISLIIVHKPETTNIMRRREYEKRFDQVTNFLNVPVSLTQFVRIMHNICKVRDESMY